MNFTTPPSTPKKRECPWAPLISRRENNFIFYTPIKGPFSNEKKCPGAPSRKKVYGKRLFITNDGQRVRIFPFIESNNDYINSCRRCLFPDKPTRIPRRVKPSSKFALSLKRKIDKSRRR
jgi:hypothetical protein